MSKVPYDPNTGLRGDCTDRTKFADFQTSLDRFTAGGYNGLGVGLFDNLGAIDIDHCTDGVNATKMAIDIISMMNPTYTEFSPSGEGFRLLYRTDNLVYDKEKYLFNNRDIGLEVYVAGSTSRFVTVTGTYCKDHDVLMNRSEELLKVADKYMKRVRPNSGSTSNSGVSTLPDDELVQRASNAKNGEKFKTLWSGNTSAYHSDSEADLALCGILAFWTGGDAEQMDRLFRKSGLMRDKWDEPRGEQKYGAFTIANAIASCKDFYKPKAKKASKTPKEPKQKANVTNRLTIEALDREIQNMGCSVRHNLLTNKYVLTGPGNQKLELDDMLADLMSRLPDVYKGCTVDNLRLFIGRIARMRAYNPVLDFIHSVVWDGRDRFQELYRLMGIENDELSKSLVRKWLFQGAALQFNGYENVYFGAEGVLVLNGGQGCGKTSLLRHLAMSNDWFLESGQIDDRDKDYERRVITTFLAELGELDATFKKADIAKLKGFVTRNIDAYRLPYGRHDVEMPRHTNIAATVNPEEYLTDDTGNRRFWTVPINKKMYYHEIVALDAVQLWAQVFSIVEPMPQVEKSRCFRLTDDEMTQLNAKNVGHAKKMKAEDEILDILIKYGHDRRPMTVTDFKMRFDPELRSYSVAVIGKALTKILGEPERCGGGKSRLRELPYREMAI